MDKKLYSLEQWFSTFFESWHPSLDRELSVDHPASSQLLAALSVKAFSEHQGVPRRDTWVENHCIRIYFLNDVTSDIFQCRARERKLLTLFEGSVMTDKKEKLWKQTFFCCVWPKENTEKWRYAFHLNDLEETRVNPIEEIEA
jgi:hypothetical protein